MIGIACNSQIPRAKWSKGWPITFCKSTKSYLSPFSKLPQGNGTPHANTIKLGRNWCGAPLPFANLLKGLKSLLELLPKVICYSNECINKSKQTNFLTLRKLLCTFYTRVLTNKKFLWLLQRIKFFACTKLSPACKFAGGIRELHGAPIMLAIYRWVNLNLNLNNREDF